MEKGREDLKMVWEASTRWNVEGKIIEREILWTEEPDTRVGWEIIEDLQGQAQPWCQRLIEEGHVDFDLPDKTLSNMELKRSSVVDGEEEDSDEELERSLAAEAFEEEAQLKEQVIIVIKVTEGGFPKNRVFPKRLRRCWKFRRLTKRGKTRKRVRRK